MSTQRQYAATIQFRTSLDQAGQIAGLAGELEIPESDVVRRLLGWSLDRGSTAVLKHLRKQLQVEDDRREEAIRKLGGGLVITGVERVDA